MSNIVLPYKPHLSSALTWKWRCQDFGIIEFNKTKKSNYIAKFSVRPKILTLIYSCIVREKYIPLTALTSHRLSLMASIVAIGHELGKDKKDGEVILRRQSLVCRHPIMYSWSQEIPIKINVKVGRKKEKYMICEVNTNLGENLEHHARATLLYCDSNTTSFLYKR